MDDRQVHIDTTVQEKAITYPTDSKLVIKIINRLNKLAKAHGIQQRRTYAREVKSLRLACYCLFEAYQKDFLFYTVKRHRGERVLNQQSKDKDKIYSLHEPQVYCIAKGKDHKPYEYGTKASIVSTATDGIILAVQSHANNVHDSKTFSTVIDNAH